MCMCFLCPQANEQRKHTYTHTHTPGFWAPTQSWDNPPPKYLCLVGFLSPNVASVSITLCMNRLFCLLYLWHLSQPTEARKFELPIGLKHENIPWREDGCPNMRKSTSFITDVPRRLPACCGPAPRRGWCKRTPASCLSSQQHSSSICSDSRGKGVLSRHLARLSPMRPHLAT